MAAVALTFIPHLSRRVPLVFGAVLSEIARNWFWARIGNKRAKIGPKWPKIGEFVAHAVHKKIGGRLTKIYRVLS